MTQTAEQFEEAISEGIKLFMRKGFVSMSVDDIVSATGLNRYAIYSAFGTKADFFRACVQHYCKRGLESIKTLANNHQIVPRETARLNLYSAAEEMCGARAGCLVCENLTDMASYTPDLVTYCKAYFSTKENIMAGVFARAREIGAIPEDVDPAAAASAFMIFKFGLSNEVKRDNDIDLLKRKIDAYISAMFRN